jgi:hypothetical protein
MSLAAPSSFSTLHDIDSAFASGTIRVVVNARLAGARQLPTQATQAGVPAGGESFVSDYDLRLLLPVLSAGLHASHLQFFKRDPVYSSP